MITPEILVGVLVKMLGFAGVVLVVTGWIILLVLLPEPTPNTSNAASIALGVACIVIGAVSLLMALGCWLNTP
jgi:hypothetical protein